MPWNSNLLLLAAAALSCFAATGDSFARDNKGFAGTSCECFCDVDGVAGKYQTFKAVAGCTAYNNKACQVEVNQQGVDLIRTGRLVLCATKKKPNDAASRDSITGRSPGDNGSNNGSAPKAPAAPTGPKKEPPPPPARPF